MATVPDAGSRSAFPQGFFARADESADADFYSFPRLVHHIDDAARQAVISLYAQLGVGGQVLDLMSSWVSHLDPRPSVLTVLGMNAEELAANPLADHRVVHDLNDDPRLPFDDDTFDHSVCTVSIDYLVRPLEVFAEVARVLRPGGVFACTFSNRCFPTKAIMGWLASSDEDRCGLVAEYFRSSGGWDEPQVRVAIPNGGPTDPLYAVWANAV